MSSLSFEAFGHPSITLKAGNTVSVDEPSAGQVKVSLKTSPVTAEDIRSLRGLSVHRSKTGVAGTYGVGTVTAVGSGVVGVTLSSQVFVASSQGSTGTWNSEALLSSQEVFTIDSDTTLDSTQAACLPEAASAWALLHSFAALSAGDVVLRSAEASPLNSAIDQIAHAEGVIVIPASASDLVDAQFKEKVASKGTAKLAITSGTGQSARAMHALTGNKGVLVTYNGAISPMTESFSGVEVPSLGLIFQDKQVCGFDFRSWVAHCPAQASQAISASVKLIQNGKLKFSPVAFSTAKFAEAMESASSGNSVVIEL